MYALGVTFGPTARRYSSKMEKSHVVGRWNEEGQTGLLRKRGGELNELVKERAWVKLCIASLCPSALFSSSHSLLWNSCFRGFIEFWNNVFKSKYRSRRNWKNEVSKCSRTWLRRKAFHAWQSKTNENIWGAQQSTTGTGAQKHLILRFSRQGILMK